MRNLAKHNTIKGSKAKTAVENLTKEVKKRLECGAGELPLEYRDLLEIDREQLLACNREDVQNWIFLVNAARAIEEQAPKLSQGKSTDWTEIIKAEKIYLSMYNKPDTGNK